MTKHAVLTVAGFYLLLAAGLLAGRPACAGEEYFRVRIIEPFIELHTGPGRNYPVYHVIDRGEQVEVLKRRTDWFLVRAANGKQGWAKRTSLEKTLGPAGEPTAFAEADYGDFSRRRWEAGVLAGDFEGGNVFSLYTDYYLTANLSAELSVAQMFLSSSDALSVSINLLAQPFPEWRLTPFFLLGTGAIQTDPNRTLVDEQDSTEQITNAGVGARWYLTRRFLLRAEYQNHVILQNKDDNLEIDEWKVGFAFFF